MTTSNWIELCVAVGTIGLASAAFWQLFSGFRTRPSLTLEPDTEGLHTRLEGEPPRMPWIRLLVRNARGRRVAVGTRVIVERYWETLYGPKYVSLAGPELGWPSTSLQEGEGAVIFGGTVRPVDFGALAVGPIDGPVTPDRLDTPELLPDGQQWWFRFTLAMHGTGTFIGREFLPPNSGGYTARLIVGADEGVARTFDVQFSWFGNAPTPDAALGSLFLSVQPAHSS